VCVGGVGGSWRAHPWERSARVVSWHAVSAIGARRSMT